MLVVPRGGEGAMPEPKFWVEPHLVERNERDKC